MLHNYRFIQFHRNSNGVNSSTGFTDSVLNNRSPGRPRWPINRLGDLEVRQGGPLGDQIVLSPKDIKIFNDAFILFKIDFQHNSV